MKLLSIAHVTACLAMTIAWQPLLAQSQPAPRLAYSAVRVIGFCVADRSSPAARRVIDLDFGTETYRTALATLVQPSDSCMPQGHVVYNPVQLGGGIAEYFLASHLSRGSLERELARGSMDRELASTDATQRPGACIIHRSPGKVVAWLKSLPDSAEEPRALRAITPDASACVAAVHSARPSAAGLRAILALTSYHIATRPGAAVRS
jgi:hypothetical protein